MESNSNVALTRLIHDVNGKCSSLKSAAALLKGESSAEELELLALMKDQAISLADVLSKYETDERAKSQR